MALPRVEVPPLVTDDRLLNQFNQQQRLANTNVFKRLETLESPQALVVPADEHTRFWWRCDETEARWNNNVLAQGTVSLVPRVAGNTVPMPAGLVYPYCLRVVEATTLANRGATGSFSATGMPLKGVTLSAWVRPGGDAGTQSFVIGVGTTVGGNVFTMLVRNDGLVSASVRLTVAGLVTLNTPGDAFCTPHEWNHVSVTFDVTNELAIIVNGIGSSNSYPAGGDINWTGTLEFDVGYPGSATLCGGCAQDIRLETTARSTVAQANAWRRGKQLTVI